MATFEDFLHLYTRRPYLRFGEQRHVGVEHELLLVNHDGSMGDALRVIADLSKRPGWRPVHDKFQHDLLIAAEHSALGLMTVDAGQGTLEWVSPVFRNLHELDRVTRRVTNELVRIAAQSSQHIVGIGMQPLTPASHERLIPKNRYGLFLKRFGEKAFGGFSVNASCQVSVDARNPADLCELTADMQALSAPLIALTANSPIAGGKRQNGLASRFDVWEHYAEPGRIGILQHRPANMAEYCRHLWELEYVFGPDDSGGHRLFGESFGAHAAGFNGDFRTHASYHRSCGWHYARACFEGTSPYVETRQPCQQPQADRTAVAALVLGLAENPEGRRDLIGAFSWDEWRRAQHTAATDGMRGALGSGTVANVVNGVLEAAFAGLKRRGLGEEDLVLPMFQRSLNGPPAFAQIEAFDRGGIPALVEQFRYHETP